MLELNLTIEPVHFGRVAPYVSKNEQCFVAILVPEVHF
jgi:hypothetical protein